MVALLLLLAALAVWLSDGDSPVNNDPRPTPTVVPSPSPTPILMPTPTPTPAPTPAPSPIPAAVLELSVWDGERWADSLAADASFREGEAVPFLLRLDEVESGSEHALAIRYDCTAFAPFVSPERDHGDAPALAPGGPGRAAPDAAISVPGDGPLLLWGGTFTALGGPIPPEGCIGTTTVALRLRTLAGRAYLMWAPEIAPEASQRDTPLRLTVSGEGGVAETLEIEPASVLP